MVFHLTRRQMNLRGGCMCKLGGCDLQELLAASFGAVFGDNASILPADEFEDCAVVEMGGQRLLMTTDMGPVVGVDLEAAGRIAALHTMSDIYARGGTPKWALATVVVQPDYPPGAMEAAMAGLLRACHEEGVEIKGGHTMVGQEAMLGLAVVGMCRGPEVLGKRGARPGDCLFLSKPLGVGMLVRGYALGLADEEALAEAVATMTQSNRRASQHMMEAGAHASTDVSGFGLLGHLSEMLGPGQGVHIHLDRVPILPSVVSLPPQVARTHWTASNLAYAQSRRRVAGVTGLERIGPLLDPQTNGGLLVVADEGCGGALLAHGFACIGRITNFEEIMIRSSPQP